MYYYRCMECYRTSEQYRKCMVICPSCQREMTEVTKGGVVIQDENEGGEK